MHEFAGATHPWSGCRQGGDPALPLGGGLLLAFEGLVVVVRGDLGERIELALQLRRPAGGSAEPSSQISDGFIALDLSRWTVAWLTLASRARFSLVGAPSVCTGSPAGRRAMASRRSGVLFHLVELCGRRTDFREPGQHLLALRLGQLPLRQRCLAAPIRELVPALGRRRVPQAVVGRAEVEVGELVPQQGDLQAVVGDLGAKRLVHGVVDLVESGVEACGAGADVVRFANARRAACSNCSPRSISRPVPGPR